MITSGHSARSHLGNSKSDSLTLSGDKDNLGSHFDVGFVTKDARQHKLCTVANGIDRSVFHDNSWISGKQNLKRHDDSSQVVLLSVLLEVPLSILNIVQSDHAAIFFQSTRSVSAEFLHVGAAAEQVSNVDAHGSNVGTSLAAHPEDAHVSFFVEFKQLSLIDCSNSKLFLDGRD